MSMNHIVASDQKVHEIKCIDDQKQEFTISFTQEIELSDDIVKICTINEEETFVIHDKLCSSIHLKDIQETIVLTKKAAEVCFKVEGGCKDYLITWYNDEESLQICLNHENDYTQSIAHLSCGSAMLRLPKDLILCDECGEHRGDIEIAFKAGKKHQVLLKEQSQAQLCIRAKGCTGSVHVSMKHPCFQQCFTLNAENHYQIQLSALVHGTYVFECDPSVSFYHQQRCFQQKIELECTNEPIELYVSPTQPCKSSLIFHNTSDQNIQFSLFSLSCHECITIEPYQSITLEAMKTGAYSIQSQDALEICMNGTVLKKSLFCIEHAGIYHIQLNKVYASQCAHLHMNFYEESLQTSYITPSEGSQRFISLQCEDTRYDLLLNAQNGFQAYLPSLPIGYYQLFGCDEDCIYMDNELASTSFCLCEGHHQLQIISPLKRLYDLTISASLLEETELLLCDGSIQGVLQSKNSHIPFCLNAENDYCVCIEQLCMDEYQLLVPCLQDYQMSYQYNGHFKSQPLFTLCDDSEFNLLLERFTYGGMLTLRLLQETSSGGLSPCMHGNYHIQMKGCGYSHTHCFNETNGYEIALCNLKAMTYDISLCEGYPVQIQSDDCDCMNSFELTQEDLCLDIILKYVNEDVVISLSEPMDCICLLCHHGQEEVLRFYEGNQYQCIFTPLQQGTYQIKGMYNQKFMMEINHRTVEGNIFHYDGTCMDICLQPLHACEIHCQMDKKQVKQHSYELIYRCNHQKNKVVLNAENGYTEVLYCQKYDEVSLEMEDAQIYVEGEKLGTTSLCVVDEVLNVDIVPDDTRCVLYMEKSQCSCMEDKIAFDIEHQGQVKHIEMNQQKGIRLHKGIYIFKSDDYVFELDGKSGVQFDLQAERHDLKIYKKASTSCVSIYADTEVKGKIYNDTQQYEFVLNEANQYLCILEHLPYGSYQIETNPLLDFYLDQTKTNQLEMNQPNHRIDCHLKYQELQIIKYEKNHDVYTRQHLNDIQFEFNGESYELNAENDWKLVLSKVQCPLQLKAYGKGKVTYLYNGVEHEHCEMNELNVPVIGIVEDFSSFSSLKIHAMLQTEGGYRTIQKEDQLTIQVNGLIESIVLNEENDYMQLLPALKHQSYELSCEQVVEYRLNGEVMKGMLHHYGDNVLLVIVQRQNGVSFQLDEKLEAAEFTLWDGSHHQKIELNQNQPHFIVPMQENHIYVIDDQDDYMYRMEDGKEVRYPVLKGNKAYQITVYQKSCEHLHTLTIEKKMMVHGELQIPTLDQSFEVDVLSHDKSQRIKLDASNHFKMSLTRLACGDYEIKEVEQNDYETTFMINEGIRSNKAIVHLQKDTHVCIINEASMKKGSLHLQKWIENSDGTLITPASGDEYRFILSSSQFKQEIILNAENQYQQWIAPLSEGIYALKEMDHDAYATFYQVNQGSYQKEAVITIRNGQCAEVNVKNQRRINLSSLNVFQYLKQNDGSYVKPKNGSYGFQLKGMQGTFNYELNEANDYQITLNDLNPGVYEIISNQAGTLYFVNDSSLSKQAVFTLESDSEMIVAMIENVDNEDKQEGNHRKAQVLQYKI